MGRPLPTMTSLAGSRIFERATTARSSPLSLKLCPQKRMTVSGPSNPTSRRATTASTAGRNSCKIDAWVHDANPSRVDVIRSQDILSHKPARHVDLLRHSIFEDPALDEPPNEHDRSGDRSKQVLQSPRQPVFVAGDPIAPDLAADNPREMHNVLLPDAHASAVHDVVRRSVLLNHPCCALCESRDMQGEPETRVGHLSGRDVWNWTPGARLRSLVAAKAYAWTSCPALTR